MEVHFYVLHRSFSDDWTATPFGSHRAARVFIQTLDSAEARAEALVISVEGAKPRAVFVEKVEEVKA